MNLKSRGIFKFVFFVTLPILISPLLFFGKEFKFLWVYLLYALFIIFEPIPLGATALLPLIFLPLFTISKATTLATTYFFDATPFVMACFMLALAVEEAGLHRRVALTMMRLSGASKLHILMAVTLSTAFVSMFITDVPVLTVVVSIVLEVARTLLAIRTRLASDSETTTSSSCSDCEVAPVRMDFSRLDKGDSRFCKAMLFCALAGAMIGGRVTLTGTVMNFIVKDVIKIFYPDLAYISYPSWLLMSVPAVPLQLLATYLIVTASFLSFKHLFCCTKTAKDDVVEDEQWQMLLAVIDEQFDQLGAVTFGEYSVTALMLLCVAAWFFRSPGFVSGWADLLPESGGSYVTDTTVSLLICLLFFIWPKDPSNGDDWTPILTWQTMESKFPWDIVLLVGSSFAITEGIKDSKFVDMLTCAMTSSLSTWSPLLLQRLAISISLLECGGANMIWVPIFMGIAQRVAVHPFYFALPIVFSSCSQFILPNSLMVLIVLQTKVITVKDLIVPGGLMQLAFAAITVLQFNTWTYWLLDLGDVPPASGLQLNCTF